MKYGPFGKEPIGMAGGYGAGDGRGTDTFKANVDLVKRRPECTGREKCTACGAVLCSAPFMYPPFFVGQMLERCRCCGAYQPPHPRAEVKPRINAHLL